MKCEKCGAEIPDGVYECPGCGNKIAENDTVQDKDINSSAVTADAAENTDADFEQRYISMFDNSADGGEDYKVDEDLKRKREARYDESFSNMTNEEKIQALEAARLARKEKREKRQSKKVGSIIPQINTDKIKESISGKSEKIKTPKPAKAEGADDSAAETAEHKDSKQEHKKFSIKPKLGIIAGCAAAVIVVGIIIASVNMASKAVYNAPEMPTIFTKGNSLYSYYDGKDIELSQNFIAREYEAASAPSASPSRSSDETDKKESEAEPIKEKDLINYTTAGDMTYFIDNADMNTNSGVLNYVDCDKKRSLRSISDNVYYGIETSDDGKAVLYLTGANEYGEGGTLNYWSVSIEKPVKVSENVSAGNFMFAAGGSEIVYVSNYNDKYCVGDLYLSSIVKGEVGESRKIDSDVYKAFGTNAAGKTVVYAKNYNSDTLCFDVYMMKDKASEPVRIADASRCEPIICQTTENMYVGGNYTDYYQSLYYASLESGQKERIATGLTELIEMSKEENAVVFRKANASGTAFDYFYASRDGSEAQELAMNITVLDDADHKRVCQFDINDSFTKAIYIQNYDTAAECGQLFSVAINNGAVASDKKISDTAYSCNLTADGSVIRFADNYDTTWNLVTLNAYADEKLQILAQEVGAGAFTFDKAGEHIVYAKNYSLETKTGDVYCVSNKGKAAEVAKGVSTYGLKADGEIVYSTSGDKGNSLYFTSPSGKRSKNIDKDITKVITY